MKKCCKENKNIQFFSVDFKVPHDCLTLYHTIPTFNDPEKEGLESIVGKRENAGYQHCFLFLQLFLPLHGKISIFQSHLFCHLQMLLMWTNLKICQLVRSLSTFDRMISVSRISSRRNMDERRGREAMKRLQL